MELGAGGCAAASLLLMVSFFRQTFSHRDDSIVDNDQSRKLLGSSVVTSVSVIMDHGNGSKTVIKEGSDAAAKPQIVGTPGSFLSPDRYEFYSLDDSGDLVKRLMSLEEIQSLIAASRPELAAPSIPVYYHRPLVEPDIADEGVQNVLANVQSVLREELAKEREPPKPQPLPIDDSWSLLLPGLFGSDIDFKQEPMLSKPIRPTPSFPESRPTAFPTTPAKPTLAEVSQGTTFGILPPVTHAQTTAKPQRYPTTKPVKYSAHYTTVKSPPLIDRLPDEIIPPIPPSTKPPKPYPTTKKPSTVIHYLPIQSISPSTTHPSKPATHAVNPTGSPPKKSTSPKVPTKTTTNKPEYNYNKTYQRITVKPGVSHSTSDYSAKTSSRPSSVSAVTKPTVRLTSTTSKPYSPTAKATNKPYIKSTHKPEIKPFTEYQKIETIATRKPPTIGSTANPPIKKPQPSKGSVQYSSNKFNSSKPSSGQKPQFSSKPTSHPTTDKFAQKHSKPSISHKHQTRPANKTGTQNKTTVRPSEKPVKGSQVTQTVKPTKISSKPPIKTTLATKPPSVATSSQAPITTSTKVPLTTDTNNLFDTIELVPITQDDDFMASSAAALIQDLLRTETDKDIFTDPTSFSTLSENFMSSTKIPVSQSSTTMKTTRPVTSTTIPLSTNPYYQVTKPTNKVNSVTDKSTVADKTTLLISKYNATKKPMVTAQKPVANYQKPSTIVQKPTKTAQKPTKTDYKPTTTAQKPVITSQKPIITSQRPIITSQKPVTSQKPIITSQKPLLTYQKPTITSQKPVTSQKPKITSQRPLSSSQKPIITSQKPVTSQKPKITSQKPLSSSKKPIITSQKPVTSQEPKTTSQRPLPTDRIPSIDSSDRPATKQPLQQQTIGPASSTVQSTSPIIHEYLTEIKTEPLKQSSVPVKHDNAPASDQKKPTGIALIPLNDIKKYSSLNHLISAKPDIVLNKTTSPPTTTVTHAAPSTTVISTSDPTESASTATSMNEYSETDKVPSNEYIDSDMIYQVISTLQSNTNKFTYPTTIAEFLTSTMRTYSTEGSPESTEPTTRTQTDMPTTDAVTILLKNEANHIKTKTPEQTTSYNTDSFDEDVEIITKTTSNAEPTTSKRPAVQSNKPSNKFNLKYQENHSPTPKDREKEPSTTTVYSDGLATEVSTTATDSSDRTSVMTTSFDDSTTDGSFQDASTNFIEDAAIQEGISAVANILLDDPTMMRRFGKPEKRDEPTTTINTGAIENEATSTATPETTTDLNLLRIETGTDNFDDVDSSTTTDPILFTTDNILPTTAVKTKWDVKSNSQVVRNDAEAVTTTKPPPSSTTTKISQKIKPIKVRPNMTPTKESKLDDSMLSEVNKLMSTAKPNIITTPKIDPTTSTEKQTKIPPRPSKLPSVKPSKNPSEKPNRNPSLKVNKTSTDGDASKPVKVELKNALNDKFFKKPGINSYQPNIQPPPAIDLHPAPQESLGLEASTAFLQEDIKKFSDLLNEIGFRLWTAISGKGGISSRSFVLSPFAATSMLAMVFLGARGPTSGQMNDVLRLDDMVTFNPHLVLKNVTESVINSKNLGVATASFVRELYSDKFKGKILDFYKERVHQYYDGHVEEVNFNTIGDIVRRRTNLLVKRQTLGKLPEYLRGSSLNMRPPLAAFTANIFQSDCEAASTEGRDGEMYFVVRPSTRQRRLVPVPAVVWRSSFLAGYEPSLDATSVCLGAESVVSTILVLPGQQGQVAPGDGLARLEQRLIETSYRRGSWSKLLRSLLPRPGLELQLPRFSHRSVLNITQALRHMGLRDLFTSKADLRGLNGVSNDLHLSDIVQVNTFSTCGEEKIGARHHTETYPSSAIRIGRSSHHNGVVRRQRQIKRTGDGKRRQAKITEDWLPLSRRKRAAQQDPERAPRLEEPRPEDDSRDGRQYRLTDAPRLRFDRPFLYVIRHNPTGVILHMGRFNPRLLP